MEIFNRFKNWLIDKLGGYTKEEYENAFDFSSNKIISQQKRKIETITYIKSDLKDYNDEIKKYVWHLAAEKLTEELFNEGFIKIIEERNYGEGTPVTVTASLDVVRPIIDNIGLDIIQWVIKMDKFRKILYFICVIITYTFYLMMPLFMIALLVLALKGSQINGEIIIYRFFIIWFAVRFISDLIAIIKDSKHRFKFEDWE